MKYFKKLVGERIYLSPVVATEEEAEKFTEWLNDFNITDYILRSNLNTTLEDERNYLTNSAKNPCNRNFFIIDSENDKLIGTIGLKDFNWIARSAVLGVFIGEKDYLSKGYGTEAINLILDFGFNYLNLHSIRLDLISENERAHKSYIKCGFKDTGVTREDVFINGKYYDTLHMDILENEFKGNYIKNKNI